VVKAAAVVSASEDYDGLYRLHGARVRRLCRLLLLDADEADDVTQEVFLKLFREHRDGGRTIAWGPWLTRVAVNACRDRRRSRWWRWWRAAGDEIDVEGLPGRRPSPEDEAVSAEQRAHIWRAFEHLPLRQREVFALRHVDGWSTEETADFLGVDAGTVKQHLFRAIRRLRGALQEGR
jgi:RNA polymerase sigma-70 factor (ECF subfamily)